MAWEIENIEKNNSFQQYIKLLIDEYRLHLVAINRSENTISWYMDILHDFFFDYISLIDNLNNVNNIGRYEVDIYLNKLTERNRWPNNVYLTGDHGKLSPFTIQGKVRALKAFWSWLYKSEYIDTNPLADYPLPEVPKIIIPILETEHIYKLLGTIDRSEAIGFRDFCIILLFLDTGARLSELIQIKLVDLNLTMSITNLIGKGNKERRVPVHPYMRKELKRFIKNHRSYLCDTNSEYLFPSKDGGHVSANCVQQMIRRLIIKAGLNGIKCHPHIFRHTFATRFIAKGGSPAVLQEIMGHESYLTTQKYVHPQPEDIRKEHIRYSPLTDLFGE